MTRQPYKRTERDLLPVRTLGRHEVGYWAMKLVKDGKEVGCCIQWEQTAFEPGDPSNRMDRSPVLTARKDGEICRLDDVWLGRGRVISEADYRYMVELAAWARENDPNSPEANPRRRIDIAALAMPF